jgi:hypothetical protein
MPQPIFLLFNQIKMSVFFNKPLQADNLFVSNEVRSLEAITGMPTRKGLERVIISEGEIVNVVSKNYGHLPNERFFNVVEENLIAAEIGYDVRSINRNNRSFAADYILNDDSFHIHVKGSDDIIKPMLRFTNSYDGSARTTGNFGFFRQVCQNGLHVATSTIGFHVKHTGDISRVVLPEIKMLVRKFMDNEYYTLQRKFEVLADSPITNVKEWVKMTADQMKLFQYEISEENNSPSLNARMVIDSIEQESTALRVQPNFWLGYNAFNEVLHNKLKKTFEQQRAADVRLFDTVLAMAN